MIRRTVALAVHSTSLLTMLFLASARAFGEVKTPAFSPVDKVNVRIGSAGDGQTFPSAGVPFAMTQWTPQTREGEAKCVAPYYAADTRIQGFRGSHFLSGSCAQDYGSFTVMPLSSPEKLDALGRSSSFSRQSEHARPDEYSVDLKDSGIHADLTGAAHSGMMRFRYKAGEKVGWIDIENNIRLGEGTIRIDPMHQEITGENPVYRIYVGNGKPAGFSGYVVMQFDHPFEVGGTWAGDQRHDGSREQHSTAIPAGGYVSFQMPSDRTVRVRIGTSFTSLDEARKNLKAEIPDWNFEAEAERARTAWNTALSSIQINGNSADLPIFYTALYHSMLLPRIFSDYSGSYPSFGGNEKAEIARGFVYYDDYSIWDTFRAIHPLFVLFDPDRERDMVRSLIAKGEQAGFLPIFPAWNSYTSEMTGDHADAIITDAYVKGIRGFDADAAYRLMRRNAMEGPASLALYQDGLGRRSLESYLQYGYIPLDDHVPFAFHKDEQTSRTLDYAFDDFEVSVLADALGHKEDAQLFAARAQNYRKVIDPESGFARGRYADGSWVTPFDPGAKATYITESTPYVYTFFVLHDVPGLIDILHGRDAFANKLDGLFNKGLYDHGNEPSHHIAYLYDDAGFPSKTQMHVHEIMTALYRNSDDGLAGNDDAGQMSAWYVFSALGFYPVTPGTPRYSIGTPHFDDMTLNCGGGRSLHIVAKGAEEGKFYVHSVRLNDVLLKRSYLLHSELIGGGSLVFEMSDHPAAD